MLGNPVAIMHTYLSAQLALMALITGGLYSPRLPEKQAPPALAFFVRGGTANPHMPPLPEPAFQFDCWADGDTGPEDAYNIYLELYDTLQGIQNQPVVVGVTTYQIKSVIEEVQGQQIQPVDPDDYHRVLGLFRVMMEV